MQSQASKLPVNSRSTHPSGVSCPSHPGPFSWSAPLDHGPPLPQLPPQKIHLQRTTSPHRFAGQTGRRRAECHHTLGGRAAPRILPKSHTIPLDSDGIPPSASQPLSLGSGRTQGVRQDMIEAEDVGRAVLDVAPEGPQAQGPRVPFGAPGPRPAREPHRRGRRAGAPASASGGLGPAVAADPRA